MNKIPLNAADFQLVDRKIINKMLETDDNYPFLRTLAFEYSENYKTISYKWEKRKIGNSKETLKVYINTAMNGLISVSDAPFRLILITGFLISFLSISYGIYFLFYNFLFQNELGKGIPTILVSILIFSGIQLLVLGFIGEYISSIHKHIKKNININEKEKINF